MIKDELLKLIKECEEIASNWNGKQSDYAGEQVRIANDIIDTSKQLIDLINELNGTN